MVMSTTALASLRAALETSGYADGAARLARGLAHTRLDDRLHRAAGELLLDDAAGSELLALFRAGAPVPAARLAHAFPSIDVGGLLMAGVVARDGEMVVPRVRIDLLGDIYVACDITSDGPEVVMGVSPATRTTAAYLPRRRGRVAWDMGTGAGMLALYAARFCDRVVATDVTDRAVAMARLNVELNGADGVDVRAGSFFEPVTGERFDLIVANPPYVISPQARYVFRDSGLDGDELSRMMVPRVAAMLEPGGMATIQINWIHRRDEPWFAAIDGLLQGSGCDALVVRIATETPLQYAYFWSAPHHGEDSAAFAAEAREWRASLDTAGVESVTTGVVILRRRADARPPTRVAVTMRATPALAIGERLEALLDTHQRLASCDDDALLTLPVRAAPDLEVRQQVDAKRCSLVAPTAPSQRHPVTRAIAEMIVALGEGRPLGQSGRPLAAELRALLKLGFVDLA